MKRPLSVFTYYRRNKRKILPVVLILAFSIVGITGTGALTDEIFRGQVALQNFYASYDLVSPTIQTTIQHGASVPTTRIIEQELKSLPQVSYAITSIVQDTKFVRVLGDNNVPIFYIQPSDRSELLTQLGWSLASGKLPAPDSNEIAVTQDILKNRGWKVGDTVGGDLDQNESLPGSNKIVGELAASGAPEKRITGGIGDFSYENTALSGSVQYTYLVHPKSGQLSALDDALYSFQSQNSKSVYYDSLENELTQLSSSYNSAKVVLALLNIVVVVVISVSVALLYIIFLMQRANEFGLLAAIGYSKVFIVRKVLLESFGQIVFGWGLGIVLSEGIYNLFNKLYFTPHGLLGANVLAPVPLLFSIPVPIIVMIVTTITIFSQLARLDPISIIERRD